MNVNSLSKLAQLFMILLFFLFLIELINYFVNVSAINEIQDKLKKTLSQIIDALKIIPALYVALVLHTLLYWIVVFGPIPSYLRFGLVSWVIFVSLDRNYWASGFTNLYLRVSVASKLYNALQQHSHVLKKNQKVVNTISLFISRRCLNSGCLPYKIANDSIATISIQMIQFNSRQKKGRE